MSSDQLPTTKQEIDAVRSGIEVPESVLRRIELDTDNLCSPIRDPGLREEVRQRASSLLVSQAVQVRLGAALVEQQQQASP
jgi:hypothetical protein